MWVGSVKDRGREAVGILIASKIRLSHLDVCGRLFVWFSLSQVGECWHIPIRDLIMSGLELLSLRRTPTETLFPPSSLLFDPYLHIMFNFLALNLVIVE